jgi:hypothetical protein
MEYFFFSYGSELLGYGILFFSSGSELLGYGILFFSFSFELLGYEILFFSFDSELLGYGILFFSSGSELLGYGILFFFFWFRAARLWNTCFFFLVPSCSAMEYSKGYCSRILLPILKKAGV